MTDKLFIYYFYGLTNCSPITCIGSRQVHSLLTFTGNIFTQFYILTDNIFTLYLDWLIKYLPNTKIYWQYIDPLPILTDNISTHYLHLLTTHSPNDYIMFNQNIFTQSLYWLTTYSLIVYINWLHIHPFLTLTYTKSNNYIAWQHIHPIFILTDNIFNLNLYSPATYLPITYIDWQLINYFLTLSPLYMTTHLLRGTVISNCLLT